MTPRALVANEITQVKSSEEQLAGNGRASCCYDWAVLSVSVRRLDAEEESSDCTFHRFQRLGLRQADK